MSFFEIKMGGFEEIVLIRFIFLVLGGVVGGENVVVLF